MSYCDGDDPSETGGAPRWPLIVAIGGAIGGVLWVLQRLVG